MEYRLEPSLSLGEDVRRIAYKQIDFAIGELTSVRDPHRSIHEARKCFKRIRALLRLAGPAIGSKAYKKEDRRIRAVARHLSGARDCQALIETVGRLENDGDQIFDAATAQSFKATLHRERSEAEYNLMSDTLAPAIEELSKLRKHYRKLELKGGRRHLARGLERSYEQACGDFKRAYASGRTEDFHNWRMSAQHHWRHMQLMWSAWPEAMRARIKEANELSQLLGFDHDLTVFMERAKLASLNGSGRIFTTCKDRQQQLRQAAHPSGVRLFSERPADFSARIMSYWKAASRMDVARTKEPISATKAGNMASDGGIEARLP